MRPAISRMLFLLPASVLVSASSCGANREPVVSLSPPADLLARPDEPPHTAAALTSEELYERERDAKIEWGREEAGIIDRACWWMQDAGVTLTCRERPE